jgi:RNA polymerase sigma-70 factor, ECF subfamily
MDHVEDRTFESFYQSEYSAVLALARVLTGDQAWAEDVTHDTFIAAYESWSDLDNPVAWVRRVVSNKARSAWRRTYAERRAIQRLSVDLVIGHDISPQTEDFWALVRKLPRNQARAIALFYLEDRPMSEIAQVIGCEESTARVHLTRGRRKLAKALGLRS